MIHTIPKQLNGKISAVEWSINTTLENILKKKRNWCAPLAWLEKEYELEAKDKAKIICFFDDNAPKPYSVIIKKTLFFGGKLSELTKEVL